MENTTRPPMLDAALVTSAVNYHGPDLLKLLVGQSAATARILKAVSLKDLDYKVYETRLADIRKFGSSVQDIIEFISSKSAELFVKQNNVISVSENGDMNYKDKYLHMLPLEYFMKVSNETCVSHFYDTIKEGDIMYTAVQSFDAGVYRLRFLAFDGGKHRYLSDAAAGEIKILMKPTDTVVPFADQDRSGKWLTGTRLKVEVLIQSFTNNSISSVLVGTKGVTLSENNKKIFKLGKVCFSDLPTVLSVGPDPTIKYVHKCLEKMDNFKNPQCIKLMASQFNIDLHSHATLMSTLRGEFADSVMAATLRKSQMCKWAHKNVADGVTHFKKGEHEEAFQCLNKALQIDPENVEAFVAKGALLANLGRYEKAVEEFEKALKYNPKHTNARKYMCETLVELGKRWEEKEKLEDAEKCYVRCLELQEDHETALKAVKEVSKKMGNENTLGIFNKEESSKEKTFLSDLLAMETELLQKKIELKDDKEEIAEMVNLIRAAKKEDYEWETKENSPKKDGNFGSSEIKEEQTQPPPLSPLSQKLMEQKDLWTRPSAAENPVTACSSEDTKHSVPNFGQPQYNIYSNPPSIWPNTSIPSHSVVSQLAIAKEDNEDQNYRDKVDQFLKQLEVRSLSLLAKRRSSKERMRSPSAGRRRKSGDGSYSKKRKRGDSRRRKSSAHSGSRAASESSTSDSGSSTSSSSTSSSSGSEKRRSRKRNHKGKKNKKRKREQEEPKREEAKKKDEQEEPKREAKKKDEKALEMNILDLKDLEDKLQTYYKKMEAMNESDEKATPSRKKKKNKKDDESAKKAAPTKHSIGDKRELKQIPAEKLLTSVQPIVVDLKRKLLTHPAFMDNDSSDDEETVLDAQKKDSGNNEGSSSRTELKDIGTKKPAAAKKRPVSSSSSSSSSSHSSSGSSGSRYSRYRRNRIKYGTNDKRKSGGSYSRSSRKSRSRSRGRYSRRSKSRGRYGALPKDRHRQRSRSRDRRRSKSKGRFISRSRDRRRSKSNDRYRSKSKEKVPPKQRSKKSPSFGYYHNKPFVSVGNKVLQGKPSILLAGGTKNPTTTTKSNGNKTEVAVPTATDVTKKPTDVGKKIKIHLNAKDIINKHLAGASLDQKIEKDKNYNSSSSVDASKRFGKWIAVQGSGFKGPEGTLDNFEDFLKKAKEKRIEIMKERNKEFLKPNF